jgi:hypothetical protein
MKCKDDRYHDQKYPLLYTAYYPYPFIFQCGLSCERTLYSLRAWWSPWIQVYQLWLISDFKSERQQCIRVHNERKIREVLGIKIERLEGGLRGHSERRDDERRRKALGCNPLSYVKKLLCAWGMSATISATTMQLCTAVQLSCKVYA